MCQQATEIIDLSAYRNKISLKLIDIVDSEELVELFGERIPVVEIVAANNQLGWPFDVNLLDGWLSEYLRARQN